MWEPVLEALERSHDVLAVNLAGHVAGPELADTPVSVNALVDAVERDLDGAGFDTAHVVGNSLGGWIAFELATRGRARSVVALAPAGGWEQGSRAERPAPVEQIKRFEILPEDFSQPTGELTPTLKVKRSIVQQKYAETIDAIYKTSGIWCSTERGPIARGHGPARTTSTLTDYIRHTCATPRTPIHP
jgi:pimeloyl-ACP methyl ester carboxylesterase